MSVTLDDILAASTRIADEVSVTPCVASIPLSELTGAEIFCKLEYLQRTGSFKERGARNALLLLTDQQRQHGVIAASAGNHALGLAYHGGLLKIPVTVVMPQFAPLIKVATCRKLGANVLLHGDNLAEAKAHAENLGAQQRLTYIHGYDDAAIIAGQGTMGLEIIDQVPDLDAVIVPIGGGGLIAGVSLAIKQLSPDVQIIGVEAENAGCYTAALSNGSPASVIVKPTLADGLAVPRIGPRSYNILKDRVDKVVTVSEESIALAILRLMELEKSVVEGAGAASLAAFLANKVPELRGKKVVLVLSGGNIDLNILDRVIEVGMVADGRMCRFTALVSDRPGGLAKLAALIASTGASVKDIMHDRAFSGPDVSQVRVVCVVETTDHDHIERLLTALRKASIEIV
ncbi:MAG: threonine ammonia-lyase [Pseudomonadota bacterium]